jgi:hypothetical protein
MCMCVYWFCFFWTALGPWEEWLSKLICKGQHCSTVHLKSWGWSCNAQSKSWVQAEEIAGAPHEDKWHRPRMCKFLNCFNFAVTR